MNSYFCQNIDSDYNRGIYNCFINSPPEPATTEVIFTTLDMFPTTIASLSASIEGQRLGLGTNLFSGEKTLASKMGLPLFDEELAKSSPFYNKLLYAK